MIIIIHTPKIDPFTTRQHISALAQRNKGELLEILGAAEPIIEELVKVKANTWRGMKGLFTSMENVAKMGLLSGVQQSAMLPFRVLSTRMGFMMESFMMPMMPTINKLTNQYESFVMENELGAIIGGLTGAIAGVWLPGSSMLWAILGSLAGSWIQDLLTVDASARAAASMKYSYEQVPERVQEAIWEDLPDAPPEDDVPQFAPLPRDLRGYTPVQRARIRQLRLAQRFR